MSARPTFVDQNLVDEYNPVIEVIQVHETDLSSDRLDEMIASSARSPRYLGLAAAFSPKGALTVMAIAPTKSRIIVLRFCSLSKPRKNDDKLRLEEMLFCNPDYHFLAFDMDHLAMSLHLDHNLCISQATDLQSACMPSGHNRVPLAAIKTAVGDHADIFADNITEAFQTVSDASDINPLVLRAWMAHYIGALEHMEDSLYKSTLIDTTRFHDSELAMLAKMARDTFRLDAQKPVTVTHDISGGWSQRGGKVKVKSEHFQSRIRQDPSQIIRVDNGSYAVRGKASMVKGKAATLDISGNFDGKDIISVTTIGREAPTHSEAQKKLLLLHALQHKIPLFDNPWIQNIWLSVDEQIWPDHFSISSHKSTSSFPQAHFNSSQIMAVQKMLSDDDSTRITLVQGPPGTGKTSVIAAFVKAAVQNNLCTIWLTAKSNVAVKNIAEKLGEAGFWGWRLIVSSEFHADWHEHLYTKIANNILTSNNLPSRSILPKQLKGCQVILCTLSMLSNPRLDALGFTQAIPMHTLVVDEASQIEVGDYASIFSKFGNSLRKVCFIGDDKQLPPYGQEEIKELKSVFQIPHLCSSAVLLDTQYRMPPEIGQFISQEVYSNKLQSNPLHPITTKSACHFIDVGEGCERGKGTSWENVTERNAVLHIARQLESSGKSYRVITPYEAQRDALEHDLKAHGLVWQDKCFNVDAFQGNEDDFIIVSLVRSRELGFLKDLRRTNVMLTRCKRGLYICTSQAFLQGVGAQSLVGRMAAEWGEDGWVSLKDLEDVVF